MVLEVLVAAELAKQCEQNVQALNDRLIVSKLVAGDVHNRADKPGIICWMHIDVGSWEGNVLKGLLHLLGPLLHEIVNIGHLLGIVHSWGRSSLV